jgi:hypothetical protein
METDTTTSALAEKDNEKLEEVVVVWGTIVGMFHVKTLDAGMSVPNLVATKDVVGGTPVFVI